jgi:PIN domain nuclease of toxin-antitoxin system
MSKGGAAPLLLDTHYWIWLQLGVPERLTLRVRETIQEAAAHGSLFVSVISVWELGMLESKGRIRLRVSCEQWVQEALATPGLALAPFTPAIALESSRLPGTFHGDPADRIIIATARAMGARLLTTDLKLRAYGRQHHVLIT